MKKNIFVTLEGVDGVGKTTVAKLLSQDNFQYYKSPSGPFAELRKEIDKNAKPLERYSFYMLAVQYDHLQITELLKRGSVVSDRYVASTCAYHFALDNRISLIHNELNIILPDFAFHLSCDSKIRDQRINGRGENRSDCALERDSHFLDQVDEIFSSFNFIRLDTGVDTAEQTAAKVKEYIFRR